MKCKNLDQSSIQLSKVVLILFFGVMLSDAKSEQMSKGKNNSEAGKHFENSIYTVSPVIVKRVDRTIGSNSNSSSNVSFSHINRFNNNDQDSLIPITLSSPTVLRSEIPISAIITPRQVLRAEICGCATLVKCNPCGVVRFKVEAESVNCPCAPKPKCAVCPPESLIHELAAKKALEDMKIVSKLRGFTNGINKYLDNISHLSVDVIKLEMKAKEMAQKMEEAGLKAQNARNKMIKVLYTNKSR